MVMRSLCDQQVKTGMECKDFAVEYKSIRVGVRLAAFQALAW